MGIRAERRSLLGRVLRNDASQQPIVDWKPYRDAGAMAWLRSRNPHVTFVIGVLTGSLLIGASAWLTSGHTISFASFGETQAASTAPRYAPLNLAKQSSTATKSEPEPAVMQTEQMARIVASEEIVELQIGRRARLAMRLDEVEELKPETVALVSGLPEDVQLSDGIRINAQLWMLRPTLLGSVEVETARGPVGRYPLTLELRTPDGLVMSRATTTLVIVAAQEDKPAGSNSVVVEERQRAETLSPAAVPAASTQAKSEPTRAVRPRNDDRQNRTPVQSPARTVVTRPEPVISPKPVEKSRSVRPNTSAAVPPIVAQGPQSQPQQKLIWPGDNPRASYTQTPPFFLGATPNTSSRPSQPLPAQDEDWHRRVFDRR